MRKKIISVAVIVVLGIILWISYPTIKNVNPIKIDTQKTSDPLNATYTIENKEVTLVNGKAEEAASSSVSHTVTTIFGQPTLGDLTLDGENDAVVFATQTSGGSGTFYYALVGVEKDGTFTGLRGVYLGDRIAPQSILIKDDVAMVNYADRNQGEPMSTAPSVGVTKYITVEGDTVKEFTLLHQGEQLFSGNLIMAPEARVFTPCGGTAHWVIGTSTAYADLTKAYNANKSTTTPYSSVYAVVSGIIVSTPTDGFGASYNYGIAINNLLKIIPNGSCATGN